MFWHNFTETSLIAIILFRTDNLHLIRNYKLNAGCLYEIL